MHEQQNSMISKAEKEYDADQMREAFKAAVLELTPDEQKELVKMARRFMAERAQKQAAQSHN